MGLGRFELPTPRLSSVCSNQLSYRPAVPDLAPQDLKEPARRARSLKTRQQVHSIADPFDLCCSLRLRKEKLLRKEVIQPQVPLRLPCYSFPPVTSHSLGTAFPCGLGKPLLEQLTPMV